MLELNEETQHLSTICKDALNLKVV